MMLHKGILTLQMGIYMNMFQATSLGQLLGRPLQGVLMMVQIKLVTITSQEEQGFINARVSQKYWMGLSDKDVEGTFKWMDGPEVEAGTLIELPVEMFQVNDESGHPFSARWSRLCSRKFLLKWSV